MSVVLTTYIYIYIFFLYKTKKCFKIVLSYGRCGSVSLPTDLLTYSIVQGYSPIYYLSGASSLWFGKIIECFASDRIIRTDRYTRRSYFVTTLCTFHQLSFEQGEQGRGLMSSLFISLVPGFPISISNLNKKPW